MKKHKFSEKLPEGGKTIIAKIDKRIGIFDVQMTTQRGLWVIANIDFITGTDYYADDFFVNSLKEENWWADPEEEES